mgnify:CR=1 FL=1
MSIGCRELRHQRRGRSRLCPQVRGLHLRQWQVALQRQVVRRQQRVRVLLQRQRAGWQSHQFEWLETKSNVLAVSAVFGDFVVILIFSSWGGLT